MLVFAGSKAISACTMLCWSSVSFMQFSEEAKFTQPYHYQLGAAMWPEFLVSDYSLGYDYEGKDPTRGLDDELDPTDEEVLRDAELQVAHDNEATDDGDDDEDDEDDDQEEGEEEEGIDGIQLEHIDDTLADLKDGGEGERQDGNVGECDKGEVVERNEGAGEEERDDTEDEEERNREEGGRTTEGKKSISSL